MPNLLMLIEVYVEMTEFETMPELRHTYGTTYHVRANTWIDAVAKVMPLIEVRAGMNSINIKVETPVRTGTKHVVYLLE